MIKKQVGSKLKASCVAIGALERGNQLPLVIGGTGFFIDPDGFLLTASHVIKDLQKITQYLYKEKGRTVDFGAFWFVPMDDDVVRLQSKRITNVRTLDLTIHTKKYLGQKDVDISIGRIEGEYGTLPFLKLKEPKKLDLYDDILICGYPGGNLSLNVKNFETGFKTSPIIQKGMISSLMPSDITKNPVGVQTDIIATGGTSGSPIVRADDCEVIGIAQNVIPSSVLNNGEFIGGANIGLVWGISNYLTHSMVEKTLEIMKPQFNNEGILKPEFVDKKFQKYKGKLKHGKLLD